MVRILLISIGLLLGLILIDNVVEVAYSCEENNNHNKEAAFSHKHTIGSGKFCHTHIFRNGAITGTIITEGNPTFDGGSFHHTGDGGGNTGNNPPPVPVVPPPAPSPDPSPGPSGVPSGVPSGDTSGDTSDDTSDSTSDDTSDDTSGDTFIDTSVDTSNGTSGGRSVRCPLPSKIEIVSVDQPKGLNPRRLIVTLRNHETRFVGLNDYMFRIEHKNGDISNVPLKYKYITYQKSRGEEHADTDFVLVNKRYFDQISTRNKVHLNYFRRGQPNYCPEEDKVELWFRCIDPVTKRREEPIKISQFPPEEKEEEPAMAAPPLYKPKRITTMWGKIKQN